MDGLVSGGGRVPSTAPRLSPASAIKVRPSSSVAASRPRCLPRLRVHRPRYTPRAPQAWSRRPGGADRRGRPCTATNGAGRPQAVPATASVCLPQAGAGARSARGLQYCGSARWRATEQPRQPTTRHTPGWATPGLPGLPGLSGSGCRGPADLPPPIAAAGPSYPTPRAAAQLRRASALSGVLWCCALRFAVAARRALAVPPRPAPPDTADGACRRPLTAAHLVADARLPDEPAHPPALAARARVAPPPAAIWRYLAARHRAPPPRDPLPAARAMADSSCRDAACARMIV